MRSKFQSDREMSHSGKEAPRGAAGFVGELEIPCQVSTRRSLLKRIVSGAAFFGLATALKKRAGAQEYFPPNLNSSWVHGAALRVEGPVAWSGGESGPVPGPMQVRLKEAVLLKGRFLSLPGYSYCWLHFAIPTPVIVDRRRVRIDSVAFFFTASDVCPICKVHVWDGYNRVAAHESLRLTGKNQFARFLVPGVPDVWNGIGLSIMISNGSPFEADSWFFSAGADYV